MKIAVFGLGYVGLTAAGCLASQGHHVLGIDVSDIKVGQLRKGHCPIKEPGLPEMIAQAVAAGRLEVAGGPAGRLHDRDLAIVCVGTPSAPDGSHDMSFMAAVTREIAEAVLPDRERPLVVAYRSTIRPGTIETLVMPIVAQVLGDRRHLIEIVYNPEFLRESVAVKDFFAPPRIVVGTADGRPNAVMDELHGGISAPIFVTRFREAEFTKFADNTFHALKVTFANELGRICAKLGVSATTMHQIFVSDTKLNISPYYLRPGGPFGGSCLPKDVRALAHIAGEIKADAPVIGSIVRSNEAHKDFLFELCTRGLAPGAAVLMVGLAFKAETDDLRESPNVDLARRMLAQGLRLTVYDPTLHPEALMGKNLTYAAANLPAMAAVLADRASIEGQRFDRVIDTNGRASDLHLPGAQIIDINALA